MDRFIDIETADKLERKFWKWERVDSWSRSQQRKEVNDHAFTASSASQNIIVHVFLFWKFPTHTYALRRNIPSQVCLIGTIDHISHLELRIAQVNVIGSR
jgi:hypothetical protein